MKIKKVLFLSLFLILGLLLGMPNKVNAAEELNKIEIEMTELEEGEIIPAYAKITLSNDTSKLVYENIELSWKVYDSEGNGSPLNITNDTKFVEDTKYGFDFKDDSLEMMISDYENKGYTFTDSPEWYVNGFCIEKENISFDRVFWINGVESANIIVDVPIVGQQLPKTLKYIFKTSTETKEIVVNCYWINGSDGKFVAEDDVTESGVVYIPGVSHAENSDEFDLYMDKIDFRTKCYINGELIDWANDTLGIKAQEEETRYSITFDANGGKFGNENIYTIDNWNANLYDNLAKPIRDGYTFKGYYTEKTGGTKFEMILNGSGIDSDMTFYAQWEEIEVKLFEYSEKQEFIVGIDKNLEFILDTDKVYGKVFVDDKELSKKNGDYIWEFMEGTYPSITLSEDYMKTLKVGKYTIKFILDDGRNAETTFTIVEKEADNKENDTGSNNASTDTGNTETNKPTGNNPQTGDNIMLFVAILGIATIGIVTTTKLKKRLKNN